MARHRLGLTGVMLVWIVVVTGVVIGLCTQ